MNLKLFAKIGIIMVSLFVAAFIFFLTIPYIANFFIDKYTPQIVGEINKATGLSAGIEELRIITTPKMTAGLKFKKFEIYTPTKKPIFIANDFEIKMSLLYLLAKNIRFDNIKLDNATITLEFDKNGEPEFLKFLPQQPKESNNNIKEQDSLPYGFMLSNNLPDVKINKYQLNITDGKNNYSLNGNKLELTHFIFNKSIKIKTNGKMILRDREQFCFNINFFNKIMPDTDINELMFNKTNKENSNNEFHFPNIIENLNALYNYKLTTNADVNLKTDKHSIDLPSSSAELKFKGNNIDIASDIYTAKNEKSTLKGSFVTGKKPFLDLNFKTDLNISNAINIIKKVALIFNINDLQTISANGHLNADFQIKSDMKNINSSGFLNIPFANLYYGQYKIGVDNIFANIIFDNNNVNIKNVSFVVLGQPLKIFGTISNDANANININATKLDLKGLLIAIGQASIMKENPIYSGNITLNAIIKGKLDSIKPIIKLNIANVDLKNIPSDFRLKAPLTEISITSEGDNFSGNVISSNVKLINPALTVSVPSVKADILKNIIDIKPTRVIIDKINFDVSGKITNYLTNIVNLDFSSTGDIKSTLKGDLNINKNSLNLVYSTTEESSIIIPAFDKSKMDFTGKINITGNMLNPTVSGNAHISKISIPEIPVDMTNLALKLHATILHGNATLQEFKSGGIIAENLSGNFELKGNDFYINNLKGSSFKGRVNGNILYNLSNAKAKIEFTGEGLNAEKAIEGAAGIKKALTGILSFNTKLTLTVLDYNDMIKSMKGTLKFDIKNGAFGSIGRFEGFLNASNIINNVLLKNTVNAISNATGLATTGEFESLNGNMTFSDGWANLASIKSAGKSLCYFITGKFNLLNGTTNVTILGRLDAPIVAKLGPIGDLSVNKLISYIPHFGPSTAKYLSLMTTNPKNEKISEIPQLTNGSTNFKDFKVVFNGGIDSKSSIKTFKWLSNPDLSQLESKSIKDAMSDIKSGFNTDVKTTVENWNQTVENGKQTIIDTKKQVNDTKEQIKNSVEEYKNLFKNIKKTESNNQNTQKEVNDTTVSAEQTSVTNPTSNTESNQNPQNETTVDNEN